MAGYVYLIGTPVFKWYKIGKSRTPEIRIQNLGILLPFSIKVIGIWKAANHTALEQELHNKYRYCQINGEWFSFKNQEISKLFDLLPSVSRIYPSENNPNSIFATFKNMELETDVLLRKRKLRGNFTPEEREARRQAAILKQKENKRLYGRNKGQKIFPIEDYQI
jgi:hypothetical protein